MVCGGNPNMEHILSIISQLLTATLFFGGCWYVWIKKIKQVAIQSMIEQEEKVEDLESHSAYLLAKIDQQQQQIIEEQTEISFLKDKFDLWTHQIHINQENQMKELYLYREKISEYIACQQHFFVQQQIKNRTYPQIISSVADQLKEAIGSDKSDIDVMHMIINQLSRDQL